MVILAMVAIVVGMLIVGVDVVMVPITWYIITSIDRGVITRYSYP